VSATVLDWPTVREQTIRRFAGDLPLAETEDAIVAVFEQQPLAVLRAIDEVAEQVVAGKVRSGWAVLRKRLEGATEPRSDIVVEADEREARVAAAEAWLRHAGLHFDREQEVVEELFGERGRLHPYEDDELLRERILRLWREQRPRGVQVEREAAERVQEWHTTRRRLERVGRRRRQVSVGPEQLVELGRGLADNGRTCSACSSPQYCAEDGRCRALEHLATEYRDAAERGRNGER
jgi:hypothetical protein